MSAAGAARDAAPRGAVSAAGAARRAVRLAWLAAALLAGCGGGAQPIANTRTGPAPGPAVDQRTPIEQRRDAACEQVGAKLTQCAVEDARAELQAGRMTKPDFDANTAPAVQRKLTEEFVAKCEVDMSSRQVRVLEVCFREEPACAPLVECLQHLNDGAK